MSADPLKPYPGSYPKHGVTWTPEFLTWWAKSQALGIQYYALGKPVYCSRREDQWVEDARNT